MSSRHITQRRPSAVLRKAVEAYRAEAKYYGKLDKWALELLGRLADSDEAAEAFERLKLKDGRGREFVEGCIFSRRIGPQVPEAHCF
jgi:hypothetical protein